MANQFAGRNLAVTIGGTAVPCPQSFRFTSTKDIVEFWCVSATGKQKILVGTSNDAEATFFPEKTDHADITSFNSDDLEAVVVYPDGNTSGNIKITFNAYVSAGLEVSQGNPGSSSITMNIDGGVTLAAATGS